MCDDAPQPFAIQNGVRLFMGRIFSALVFFLVIASQTSADPEKNRFNLKPCTEPPLGGPEEPKISLGLFRLEDRMVYFEEDLIRYSSVPVGLMEGGRRTPIFFVDPSQPRAKAYIGTSPKANRLHGEEELAVVEEDSDIFVLVKVDEKGKVFEYLGTFAKYDCPRPKR